MNLFIFTPRKSSCDCLMFVSLSLVTDSSATLVIDRKINTADFTNCTAISFETFQKQHKFFFPGRLSSVFLSLLHSAVKEDVVQQYSRLQAVQGQRQVVIA